MSGETPTYWEAHRLEDVVTSRGPGGGGTVELRHGKTWMNAESVKAEADWRVKLIRSELPSVLDRERERIASIGFLARQFRRAELDLRRFALTASFGLPDAGDPEAGEQFRAEFDLLSEDSVDSALESYRQFVIETTTAALRVEQQIARECATRFWTGWEGS